MDIEVTLEEHRHMNAEQVSATTQHITCMRFCMLASRYLINVHSPSLSDACVKGFFCVYVPHRYVNEYFCIHTCECVNGSSMPSLT
jgi:hypothetical protein